MNSLTDYEIQQALLPWVTAELKMSVTSTIKEFKRHTEGWSWQTYTFIVEDGQKRKGVAIRRQPEDGLLAPYDIVGQYNLHKALLDFSKVSIPELIALEMSNTILGMPFYAMSKVDGIIPVQWNPDDPAVFPTPLARRQLAEDFVSNLVSIHSADIKHFEFLKFGSNSQECTNFQLERWERSYAESYLHDVPLIRLAFRWLRDHMPDDTRLGLCHGDYRIGNFITDQSKIVAILDWELAHIGDVVSDISWAGLPLFRGRSPLFSHLCTRDEFLALYNELSGRHVSAESLNYWNVFNLIKAAVPHIRAAKAFEDGRSSDLRLAAMGHQVIHTIKHLVVALEEVV
jgi:aminoglycoside phosphotransferase (APT) family kinase protein